MAKYLINERVQVHYSGEMYNAVVKEDRIEREIAGNPYAVYTVELEYPRNSGSIITVDLPDRAVFRHPQWVDPDIKHKTN